MIERVFGEPQLDPREMKGECGFRSLVLIQPVGVQSVGYQKLYPGAGQSLPGETATSDRA